MQVAELAKKLIDASPADRRRIANDNADLLELRLSDAVREECIAAWSSDPRRVKRCVAAAKFITKLNRGALIKANADWVNGIGEIIRGRFASAIAALDLAEDIFDHHGEDRLAAQTNVAKLLALAMLGRYDDAISTGLAALKVMVRHDDKLAAGKVEMNLSNIVSRRSDHREAERFCLSARKHFVEAGEQKWQAMAENGLANTYAEQNDFAKAERYYAMAFETAVAAGMHVTEAEIEASMGNLAMLRGRYADALRHLERSRRKFEILAMPHQRAIADLEIADIYAELNLNSEAIEIYGQVTKAFRGSKLQAEEARARLNYGRAAMKTGDYETARIQLTKAAKLYAGEDNAAGQAAAEIANARLAISNENFEFAISIIHESEHLLSESQNVRLSLDAKLIEGEAYLRSEKIDKARSVFEFTLNEAKRLRQPDSVQISLNFLGRSAMATGDIRSAESYLKRSIRVVEKLRAPLASEEFSLTFLAARLRPYDDLARLYISTGRTSHAFHTIESRQIGRAHV